MTKYTEKTRTDMDALYEFVKQNQPVNYRDILNHFEWEYRRLYKLRRNLCYENKFIQNQNPYAVWFVPAEMSDEQWHQYRVIKANCRSLDQWQDYIWSIPGVDRLSECVKVTKSPEQLEQERVRKEKELHEYRSEFVQKLHNTSYDIESYTYQTTTERHAEVKETLDKLVHEAYLVKSDRMRYCMAGLYFVFIAQSLNMTCYEEKIRFIADIQHELVSISFDLKLNVDIIG